MSNVAGKAYAMTVLTPIRPHHSWINRLIFEFSRAKPAILSRLLGLSFIHFARWVIIRREQWPDLGQGRERLRNDYMLFSSNFNGTWDQYIDAFSSGTPSGLNLYWYGNTGFPGAVPITPFKNYIRANQIDTDYYFNATPGATQRDIKGALLVRTELLALAEQHAKLSAEDFAKQFWSAARRLQNELGIQGPAPVASTDTARALANKIRLTATPPAGVVHA